MFVRTNQRSNQCYNVHMLHKNLHSCWVNPDVRRQLCSLRYENSLSYENKIVEYVKKKFSTSHNESNLQNLLWTSSVHLWMCFHLVAVVHQSNFSFTVGGQTRHSWWNRSGKFLCTSSTLLTQSFTYAIILLYHVIMFSHNQQTLLQLCCVFNSMC